MLLHAHVTPTHNTSPKTPLVFLHGLFGQGRNFRTLERLFSEDRDVASLDLRNHGASPHGPMNYPQMAEDVYQTLAEHKLLPCILVGHSMGGKTAMCMALHYPQDVKALVLLDIPPAPTTQGGLGIDDAIQHLSFPQSLTLREADELLKPYVPREAVRQVMLQNIQRKETPHWRIGIDEIFADMPNIKGWPSEWARGKHYDGPTLFVAGSESPYLRDEHKSEIKKLFPKAQHVTLPHCGHWVHAQAPRAFRAVLKEFLETED